MFNKYPYTDLHELNLDWFLNQFKELVSDWEEFHTTITREWNDYKSGLDQEWEDVQEAWTTLYNYVHDYFDNLDVQTEIDHKLDEMAADGTLLAVIQSTVTTTTSGWLADHITNPSNPPIDTSLSVPGAAADAAVVGAELINRYISTSDAIDEYYINATNGEIGGNVNFSYITFNVIPGDILLYKTQRSETNIGIAFYDRFGIYIAGYPTDGTELSLTVPSDAVICRASYRTLQISNFYVKIIKNAAVIPANMVSKTEIANILKALNVDTVDHIAFNSSIYTTPSTNRARTTWIVFDATISGIELSTPPVGYKYSIMAFDDDSSFNNPAISTGWYTTAGFYANNDGYKYHIVMFSKTDNSDISSADRTYIKDNMSIDICYKLTPIDTCYVSTAGSDSDLGNAGQPFATIQHAIDMGYKNIIVDEGTYPAFTMTNCRNVHIMLNMKNNTYVAGSDEDNPKITITGSSATGITMNNCTDCIMENISVDSFTNSGFKIDNCSNLKFIDCIAHDIAVGQSAGGGYIITDTDADFIGCGAYNIGETSAGSGLYHIDGFNIHNTGTTNFYNCWAYNCMDDGISHHDACYGLIDGGEWHHCGKGGVASPTHGAVINVQNIYSHDNDYGIYCDTTGSTLISTRPAIQFTNCICKNNSINDIKTGDFYSVNIWNCIYDTIAAGANTSIIS